MLSEVSIPDQGLLALLGWAVVFVGLIALMLVVMAVGKAFSAKKKAKEEPAAAVVVEEDPAAAEKPLAPGSCGELKLYDTPPKTAAMLMAIVADQMGKPLNELRFISIKEVK